MITHINLCTFGYDLARGWCRTTFPTGRYTEKTIGAEDESPASLDKFAGWGYERSKEGVAKGLIEHEYNHSLVPIYLFGLPWSPELFSQAHGFITSYKSEIPAGLKPDIAGWSIPFEESLNIATVMYIRNNGKRHSGWRNKAFPDSDPLDYIASRTDLDSFAGVIRARLDGLWRNE